MTAPTIERPPPPPAPTESTAAAPAGDAAAPDVAVERRAAVLAALAGALGAAGAAWMLAGVFAGGLARGLAVLAAVVGPAAVAASIRARRPAAVQTAGAAAVIALAVLAGTAGRPPGSSLARLVTDALRSGGLADAPVAFDHGWRAVLVVVAGMLGLAAAGLAAALRRPRLALAVVAPVLAAGTLVQPRGAEVASAVVALGLLVAAFGVGAAADLVREGASSGRFELARAGRGAALLAAVVLAMVAAGRLGVLLPAPAEDVVVPPQRPRPSPPLGDRDLFLVTSDRALPWRLGTLDVYDGTAWLTPPFDPGRFEDPVGPRGVVPTPTVASPAATVDAVFEVRELAGRALPALANPVAVDADVDVQVDPRTQVVRLRPGATAGGRRYTVTAVAPPTGAQLAEAPAPGPALRPFLEVPPPPAEVADLLEDLPDVDPFNRLQAARQAYYDAVVAAGAGDPVDVTPLRVAELLQGREGTPYEIAAGEALLARWVGVPARLGYGWFGGDLGDGGVRTVRPEHGATWLEAWFEGHGWVPLVGRPPRAKASLSKDTKSDDPSVRPTDRLTVFTYVPVRLQGLRQSAEVARYWALRVVPAAALVALAVTATPALRKLRRRRARRRWASGRGPSARLAVSYAEVRDLLTDLGVGRPTQTPLEALAVVEPDDEHAQLAWLVTRGLWGDLARDLTAEDAATGEALAGSVRRRLLKAQPLGARIAAALSRTSLREPWALDLPGAPAAHGGRPARPAVVAAAAAVVVLATSVAVAAATLGDGDAPPPRRDPSEADVTPLREPIAPDVALGDVVIRRERSAEAAFGDAGDAGLVAAARVFAVQVGPDVEGSLQAASLRPELASRGDEVVGDVLRSLAGGGFTPTRFGGVQGYALDLPDQRIAVWFTPDLRAYLLLVTRAGFDRGDELFAELLAAQRGRRVDAVDVPVPDPRRVLP